jgi:2-deoxy-D-gluconate 3-dehydrogenase
MSDIRKLFDLTDRVAIVTGGAGLLGTEFSKTLAEAGAAVTVADIDVEAAKNLAVSMTNDGYHVQGLGIDITSPESVNHMLESTVSAFGRLDILVNSAAMDPKFDPSSSKTHSGAFEDYPLVLWQQALDVNLTGTMLCCQAAVQPMLAQGAGIIINIASIYGVTAPDQRIYQRDGHVPAFKPAYYTVTKAGILGLTKYLSAYFSGKNIRVNALTPGGVYHGHDQDFIKAYAARSVLGRMAEKDEMNGALLFLASDASKYMTGANLIVDGGWTIW